MNWIEGYKELLNPEKPWSEYVVRSLLGDKFKQYSCVFDCIDVESRTEGNNDLFCAIYFVVYAKEWKLFVGFNAKCNGITNAGIKFKSEFFQKINPSDLAVYGVQVYPLVNKTSYNVPITYPDGTVYNSTFVDVSLIKNKEYAKDINSSDFYNSDLYKFFIAKSEEDRDTVFWHMSASTLMSIDDYKRFYKLCILVSSTESFTSEGIDISDLPSLSKANRFESHAAIYESFLHRNKYKLEWVGGFCIMYNKYWYDGYKELFRLGSPWTKHYIRKMFFDGCDDYAIFGGAITVSDSAGLILEDEEARYHIMYALFCDKLKEVFIIPHATKANANNLTFNIRVREFKVQNISRVVALVVHDESNFSNFNKSNLAQTGILRVNDEEEGASVKIEICTLAQRYPYLQKMVSAGVGKDFFKNAECVVLSTPFMEERYYDEFYKALYLIAHPDAYKKEGVPEVEVKAVPKLVDTSYLDMYKIAYNTGKEEGSRSAELSVESRGKCVQSDETTKQE